LSFFKVLKWIPIGAADLTFILFAVSFFRPRPTSKSLAWNVGAVTSHTVFHVPVIFVSRLTLSSRPDFIRFRFRNGCLEDANSAFLPINDNDLRPNLLFRPHYLILVCQTTANIGLIRSVNCTFDRSQVFAVCFLADLSGSNL